MVFRRSRTPGNPAPDPSPELSPATTQRPPPPPGPGPSPVLEKPQLHIWICLFSQNNNPLSSTAPPPPPIPAERACSALTCGPALAPHHSAVTTVTPLPGPSTHRWEALNLASLPDCPVLYPGDLAGRASFDCGAQSLGHSTQLHHHQGQNKGHEVPKRVWNPPIPTLQVFPSPTPVSSPDPDAAAAKLVPWCWWHRQMRRGELALKSPVNTQPDQCPQKALSPPE